MDLRFIESLIWAVDLGSVAGAARRLNVTPAAVSQRILALEAELKVALLLRDGRTMTATPDCLLILPDLRRLLQLRAGLDATLVQDQLQGALRVGAISTMLGVNGVPLVHRLRAEAPEIELSLLPGSSQELFARFERGELDAALMVKPPFELPKTMQFLRMCEQKIGVFARPDLALDAPFIAYIRETWGGAKCWRALKAAYAAPEIICEMDAVETITQLVRDGLGRAVLPMWAGMKPQADDLVFTPLSASREVGLLTWRKDRDRPVQAIMRAALGLKD
ncbi:LysR family transcriptional regulator [Cognatishimia sp. WU-CL00825]|uniref:LysR family transcriptional regulator n=1 Tax=Cognatishimia sp. WU-CL00825 TaxID=3127658 RepID=UPI00310592D7